MKEISLTRGMVAFVDDEDFELLNSSFWQANPSSSGRTFYAIRFIKKKRTAMHRVIMNVDGDYLVDHINHNGLDNRRSNLRICTRSQNRANMSDRSSKSAAGFIGVALRNKSYQARIMVDNRHIYGGQFSTPEEAARARDEMAIRYFGEFAALNFPRSE